MGKSVFRVSGPSCSQRLAFYKIFERKMESYILADAEVGAWVVKAYKGEDTLLDAEGRMTFDVKVAFRNYDGIEMMLFFLVL